MPRLGASAGGWGLVLSRALGWKPAPLHTSTSVLVAVVLSIPLVLRSFFYLGRESGRSQERAHSELAAVPDLEEQLAHQELERSQLNARFVGRIHPPLEQQPFVAEVLNRLRLVIQELPGGPSTVSFLLVRGISGHRYKVVSTRGPVEDDFKNGTVWTAAELLRDGDAFRALFAPFQYRRTVVLFSVGTCQYFLVAMAGSEFPDMAVLRVSGAATLLMRALVAAKKGEDWEFVLEAASGGGQL